MVHYRLFLRDVLACPVDGGQLVFGNQAVHWVRVFGFVMDIEAIAGGDGFCVRIDDGSAEVSVSVPQGILELGDTSSTALKGQLVECLGSLRLNNGDRSVMATSMRVLMDPIAECRVALEIIKLYKEKYGIDFGKRPNSEETARADIAQPPVLMSNPETAIDLFVAPAISQRFFSGLSQFSQYAEMPIGAHEAEVEAAIAESKEGISQDDLQNRLTHISRMDLANTVEQLMADGHIYEACGLLYIV